MPHLERAIPFYSFKKTKKEERVLAKILKMYVASLESCEYNLNDKSYHKESVETVIG